MGCDIHMFAEYFDGMKWHEIEYSFAEHRDYGVFGCLFGVRNYNHFKPLFACRGIPYDTAVPVQDDPQDYHSHTWVTFAELEDIRMDEEAEEYSDSTYVFEVQEDGTEILQHSYLSSSEMRTPEPGEEIRVGNTIYRRLKLTRRDSLEGSILFEEIEELEGYSEMYGSENVRLVVWFDN